MKPPFLTSLSREKFIESLPSGPKGLDEKTVLDYFDPVIQQIDKFAEGRFFWFIADAIKVKTLSAGGSMKEMVGKDPLEVIGKPPDWLFEATFPPDLGMIFSFSQYFEKYLSQVPHDDRVKIHGTIYMRLKDLKKDQYWVKAHYLDFILNEKGRICYLLTMVSDISHLKKDEVPMITIINFDKKENLVFKSLNDNNDQGELIALPNISARETDVLDLLAGGNSSKQIADMLNISKKTVDNHRQNLLKKTGRKNTGELISYALLNGFI